MEKKTKQCGEVSKRSPNWSESERDVLVTNVIANYSKLFGKFSNSVSHQSKEALWSSITEMVNSQSSSAHRTVAHSKKQWIDLKSTAKKQAAVIYKNLSKTGGGDCDEEMMDLVVEKISTCENWAKKIVRVIGEESFAGIDGGVDFASVPPKRQLDPGSSTASPKRLRLSENDDEGFTFGAMELEAEVPSVSTALCLLSEESRDLSPANNHNVVKHPSSSKAKVHMKKGFKGKSAEQRQGDRKNCKENSGSVAEQMLSVQEKILLQLTNLNENFAALVKAVAACSERLGPVFFTK